PSRHVGLIERGLLEPHALGDVARDLRRAYHASIAVVYGRHRHRNRNELPVLALPDGLVVPHCLTGPDASEDEVLFVLPIGWNDDADGAADHLVGAVAKDAFGRVIPELDDAVEVLADDRVVRRLDDAGQEATAEAAGGMCHVTVRSCKARARKNRRSSAVWSRNDSPGARTGCPVFVPDEPSVDEDRVYAECQLARVRKR